MSKKSEKLKATSHLLIAPSQESAAFTLGVDVRTLQRWSGRGCPGERGRYVIKDLITWAREHVWNEESEILDGADETLKNEYLRQRIERLKRETVLQDLKIDQQSEALVDANEVRALLLHHAAYIRSGLEKLERKYGADALNMVLELFDELDALDFQLGATS